MIFVVVAEEKQTHLFVDVKNKGIIRQILNVKNADLLIKIMY